MGRELVQVVEVVGGDAAVEARAEALGGLGGVLGDVAGHLLGRQLSGLAAVSGDVVDVELLAPAGIPLRSAIDGRAGHGHGRRSQGNRLLEQTGGERLRGRGEAGRAAALGGRVQAQDGVEVDGASALELGYLGIGDPDEPAQLLGAHANESGQGTLDGDGGPTPQLGGERVPQHLRLGVVAGGAERLAEAGVVLLVAVPAAGPPAVGAASTLPVRVAGQHQAPLGLAGMDPAEAGGGVRSRTTADAR
jgi:hypothetical protein